MASKHPPLFSSFIEQTDVVNIALITKKVTGSHVQKQDGFQRVCFHYADRPH